MKATYTLLLLFVLLLAACSPAATEPAATIPAETGEQAKAAVEAPPDTPLPASPTAAAEPSLPTSVPTAEAAAATVAEPTEAATAEPTAVEPVPAEVVTVNGSFEGTYFRGSADAPVTMIDYSDFL